MAGSIILSRRIAFSGLMVIIALLITMVIIYPVRANSGDGSGPGGVGSIDGTSNLQLWLRADRGVYTDEACTSATGDSGSVACWADQSGNGNHFKQSTTGSQPTYTANGQNGQPILQFNGSSQYLEKSYTAALNNDSFTVFVVACASSSSTSIRSPYASHCSLSGYVIYASDVDYWNFWISKGSQWSKQISSDYDVTGWHILTGYHDYDAWVQSFDIDGTNIKQYIPIAYTKNPSCPTRIGAGETQQASPGLYFPGSIAEVIVYNTPLNMAERTLVNNYLSAKYNITINNDKYSGSDPPYIYDVAGIGMEDGNQTQGASAGMILTENNFLQNNGDYILIGHTDEANANTTDDLPSGTDWTGNGQRWARNWYLLVTDKDSTGGAIDISFDISDSGMSGIFSGSANNYRLLKRSGSSGAFSDIATAASINGDRVLFENVNISLLGSYFTLGTVDNANSPTAITLQRLGVGLDKNSLLGICLILIASSGISLIIFRSRRPKHF